MKPVDTELLLEVEACAELIRIIEMANAGKLRVSANVARKLRAFCIATLNHIETDPVYANKEAA